MCVFCVSRSSSVFGGVTVGVELCFPPPACTPHSDACMWLHWGVTCSVSTLWVKPIPNFSKLNFTEEHFDTWRVFLLSQDSGDVLWSHRRNVPFFSSPNASSGHVVIGSVDGNICCFSNTGEEVRRRAETGVVLYCVLSFSVSHKIGVCPPFFF